MNEIDVLKKENEDLRRECEILQKILLDERRFFIQEFKHSVVENYRQTVQNNREHKIGLHPNYEKETGLDQVSFEVPYELFKTLLKRTGQRLTHEEFLSITIHPANRTKKTVRQYQFLFSIWMNDNIKNEVRRPSEQLQTGCLRTRRRRLGRSSYHRK